MILSCWLSLRSALCQHRLNLLALGITYQDLNGEDTITFSLPMLSCSLQTRTHPSGLQFPQDPNLYVHHV